LKAYRIEFPVGNAALNKSRYLKRPRFFEVLPSPERGKAFEITPFIDHCRGRSTGSPRKELIIPKRGVVSKAVPERRDEGKQKSADLRDGVERVATVEAQKHVILLICNWNASLAIRGIWLGGHIRGWDRAWSEAALA
jgi:hypothetical protein